MKQLNHEELAKTAYWYYKKNKPLLVLGRTGIGKSYSIKEASKRIAEETKKAFTEWDAISVAEKHNVIENPDKYFVYVDLRLTQLEPSDLRGLPLMGKKNFVEWQPNLWAEALRVCQGVLFFDEINLASPSLQATVYQILLEKQIGEHPLHPDVMVFGAGNLSEDRAGTYEIPKPILTRAGIYELTLPKIEDFTTYAINKGMDSRVITFLNKMQKNLFVEDEKNDDIITPRDWESVSGLIDGLSNNQLEDIELYTGGLLGEAISMEFTAYIKLANKIPTPQEILSKKKKIPNETDLRYACVAAVVEYYRQQSPKDRKKVVTQLVELKDSLDAEFFILSLRLVKGIEPKAFADIVGTPAFKKIMEFKDYLVD